MCSDFCSANAESRRGSLRKYLIISVGAGEGNRTLVCSLGSCRSTIELHPRRVADYCQETTSSDVSLPVLYVRSFFFPKVSSLPMENAPTVVRGALPPELSTPPKSV